MQRRDFLIRTMQAGAILPLAGSGVFARPLAPSFFARPASIGDRVLVLINLNGGNDGLNTIVPVDDPLYVKARPSIGLKQSDTLKLTDDLRIHSAMSDTLGLYNAGQCAIVQNVGYADQDRSHFRSTDIWHTGADADQINFTGWLGRYLEKIHPEYPDTLPTSPFAIQISSSVSLALLSSQGNMGIAIDNPDRFYNLANGLEVPPDPVPATLAGPELVYVRAIIEQSNAYSKGIQKAMVDGSTNAAYGNDSLSLQLKVVARLINGGARTGVYIVTLNGFDTHQGQLPRHAQLLSQLSSAVNNFLTDVAAAGNADRVVCMTYSEFGRRLNENGSTGTDHGAAAPQFVFGKPVLGGKIIGGPVDLDDLDDRGDIKHSIDYRQIYSSVLEDWLGLSTSDTRTVLGGEYTKLPLFNSASGVHDARYVGGIRLEQNVPNPASTETLVTLTLPVPARVHLRITTADGHHLRSVVDRSLTAGTHSIPLRVDDLAPGAYLYILESGKTRVAKKMSVVR